TTRHPPQSSRFPYTTLFRSPPLTELLSNFLPAAHAATLGFVISFVLTTSLFIVITDLIPKQVAMAMPEHLALRVIGPMRLLNTLLKPLVVLYVWLANSLIRLFNLPNRREELITPGDILAMTEAGAQAGTLAASEQQVIENIFE